MRARRLIRGADTWVCMYVRFGDQAIVDTCPGSC